MEFGKILLGAFIGAGALYLWQERQENKKENPMDDLEILGLQEKIDRLSEASAQHTPAYLNQPAMMPMPYQQPMYPPYGRGLF